MLERHDAPSREEIVEAISGNICRCTGYGQIVEAVEYAAERLRKTNMPRHLQVPKASTGADAEKSLPPTSIS